MNRIVITYATGYTDRRVFVASSYAERVAIETQAEEDGRGSFGELCAEGAEDQKTAKINAILDGFAQQDARMRDTLVQNGVFDQDRYTE